ncbi:MAG: hypothetical protein VX519_10335 [Myxococcota bacterium]|nr:hypothetical protein [Myxococcota bacterium]
MVRILLGMMFLQLGCSEHGFHPKITADPGGHITETTYDTYALDTGIEEPDTDPEPDTDRPETPPEPPEWIEDCGAGTVATLSPGEIYVLSWTPTEASGTIQVPQTGWYHLYDYAVAESGASQTNEVMYVRAPNSDHPAGRSMYTNCGQEWIVEDSDNSGAPPSARQYLGTFWLMQGTNDLEIYHYCPLYRSGTCTQFHNTSDAGSTCESTNVNSTHLTGLGLCLIRR